MTRRALALLVTLLVLASAVAVSCSDGEVLPASSAPTTTADAPGATTPPASSTTEASDPDDGLAGAPGLGDPYFPELGNGGYDVIRYDLAIRVDGEVITGTVEVDATATQDLDTFNLDFDTFTIERVAVDGADVEHELVGEELVIDPAPVIAEGTSFTVEVRYSGEPTADSHPVLGPLGWQRMGGVTFVSDEPSGAHTWFPSNDHPADKAAFRIALDVPVGTTAVASGVLVSNETVGGRTTWVWDHPDPIPTYVVAVAIGDLTLVESDGPHGIRIRHAFPPALADEASATFADTAQLIVDLEAIFGPYPFDSYGALVVDGELGYAMENQTLSLYPRSILDGSNFSRVTIVHELAHHWFGNWVSPASWDETWLNEGFAAYAEHLWLEHTDAGYDIDGAMAATARRSFGPIGDPGEAGMFSSAVYDRGALTLHALRRTIGDAAFFQVLRAWSDRYGGRSASTDDLVALATEVSGQDLEAFFQDWLFAPTMPRLPA